jgi:hypothetical protein
MPNSPNRQPYDNARQHKRPARSPADAEHLVIGEGRDRWHAIIEASKHRMRTIASIAAAASHALIPIARDVFESRWHTSSSQRDRARCSR